MMLTHVLALFTLSMVVYGNLLAAVARPAILSFSTIYVAFNQFSSDKDKKSGKHEKFGPVGTAAYLDLWKEKFKKKAEELQA